MQRLKEILHYLGSWLNKALHLFQIKPFGFAGVLLPVLFGFIASTALAQDIHFTQYFANPLSINPAMTGFYNGSYRLGLNYKAQYPFAIDSRFLNYNTTSVYGDFSILDNKINSYDWAGIGLNYTNDVSGDGNLRLNKINLALAYHKGLDRYNKHHISIGISGAYVHRAINFDALFFNNQWVDRVGFNLNLPTNEEDVYQTDRTGYFDLTIGLQGRNKISDKLTLGYGFSMLHLTRPTESFYGQDNKQGIRYVIQLLTEYKISQRVELHPSAYFTTQKRSFEALFGLLGGYRLNKNGRNKTFKLHYGAYYRVNDALAVVAGGQYHRTRLLFNYDINLSSLTRASQGRGSFEFSLIHIGTFARKKNFNKKVFCPVF